MSLRQKILTRLTESQNLAVEHAVEVALQTASATEQMELADVLLERNRRAGWVALIRVFDRLAPDIQEKLLARPRDLFGPLSETMQDPEGSARENVIGIVRRCADGKLVYLLAEALMDSRPEVRELAGKSLLEATRKECAPRLDGTEQDPATLAQLRRAIDFALRQYRTHRQQTALVAALVFERQQDAPLWAHFQDPYGDLTRAATSILRAPTDPDLAAASLLALGSALRPAAMAGLAAIDAGPVGEAFARQSFRLLDPCLRTAAQNVGHMKLLLTTRRTPSWSTDNWLDWLRLIDAVGLQPTQRLALLESLLQAAPPTAVAWKLVVLQSIAEIPLDEAGHLITPLVNDADERVARTAARYLLNKHRPVWRDLAATCLPKSPHMPVRRMAIGLSPARTTVSATSAAEPGFQKVWREYQQLPPAVQHNTTRLAVNDPKFADALRIMLGSRQPLEVAQGLKMLNAVTDLHPYRTAIIALCGNADARIAAIAVRLIGRLEDPRLKDLLEAAAQHTDPRVRANAVESMSALRIADHSQQVLQLLNSRHNRERANAIRAISQFDYATARECLARMLADPNPMHRISALWVVGQLQMLEIVRQVSSIARRDPNHHVRARAASMLATLNAPTAATAYA